MANDSRPYLALRKARSIVVHPLFRVPLLQQSETDADRLLNGGNQPYLPKLNVPVLSTPLPGLAGPIPTDLNDEGD